MKDINFETYDFKATAFYQDNKAKLDAWNDKPNLKNELTRTRYAADIYVEYGILAPWYDSLDELIADCHKEMVLKQLTGRCGLKHAPERGVNIATLISGMGNLPIPYWIASLASGVLSAAYGAGNPMTTGSLAFFSTQVAGFAVSKTLNTAGENSANDRLNTILPELRPNKP